MVKNKKDIFLGLSMFLLSFYILFGSNVVKGSSLGSSFVYLARADVYLKGLATLLCVLSLFLIVRSIFKVPIEHAKFMISKEVLFTVASLFVYLLILKSVGFILSSFLLVAFLSFTYRAKEIDLKLSDKKTLAKSLLVTCIFSLISVLTLYFIFTTFLNVILP